MSQRYYTLRKNVPEIIQERKRDDGLRRRIREFYQDEVGISIPFTGEGVGILARHIPVSRNETFFAKALADELEIDFGIPSFSSDRFVNCSPEKRSFLKFEEEKLGTVELVKGAKRERYDRNKSSLKDIFTEHNQLPILTYHMERTRNTIGDFQYFDFNPNGLKASTYYAAYLAMFGGVNCLFEDFHGGESGQALAKFTKGVFEPAFDRVESELGIKPIITQIPFEEDFGRYIFCPQRAKEKIEIYKERIRNDEL